MLFNSFGYIAFLVIAVSAHWLLPHRARMSLLAAASIAFYAMWRWEFALLMVFSAVVDYVASLQIAGTESPGRRRAWLITSLSVNLGLLVFFKYTYFLSDSLGVALASIGIETHGARDWGFEIILPLGISFYTFQTISYTIDVYRRLQVPTRDFVSFVTYVTFWPQLIAGPILRASEVIPQLESPRRPSAEDFWRGILLILVGLTKKVVFADSIAPMVDAAFERDLADLTAYDTWVMTTLFGFQIYFDFSGYSDVAIGSARILGIGFPKNFDWPYLSTSPREFWKRWHISLSSWIRDYLYTPLTGRVFQSRSQGGISVAADSGTTHATAALFATWFIMGLWHGAAWTFAIWGIYHAAAIWIFRTLGPLQRACDRLPALGWGITFAIAMAGWIPFRAQSVNGTMQLFSNLVDPSAYLNFAQRGVAGTSYMTAVVLIAGMLACATIREYAERWTVPRPVEIGGLTAASAALFFLVLTLQRPIQQFIYFQF